ncbi:MAG TPA: isochorismatase family cysteine hydrolase [Verrucomicrobiae bacterium]|nr:isochorismatase family cysteine hydrolase [Verrucomicrobiae bacterium]
MTGPKTIFWEVDVQSDFMLPGGKLYVPGAEKIIPNVKRLVDQARDARVLLVSSGDSHPENDPEFATFSPHCLKGTPGADLLPEAQTEKILRIPNDPSFKLPEKFNGAGQIHLEKQTLDVFRNVHADEVVERLGRDAEFVVFGVVTEYCVRCAAKGLLDRGRKVALVTDAIEQINPADGRRALDELKSLGARFITTDEALSGLRTHSPSLRT